MVKSTNIWKNVFTNIKREQFLSISNVLVMTITFLLLGLFVYTVVVSQTALRYLEHQVQLSVFFKDDFNEEAILNLKSQLESDSRVSEVKYISKEDAFKIFSEINKDDPILLQSISPSILPASLEVKTYDIAQLSPIAEELSAKDGVEEVRFFKDVVQKFRTWSTVVYVIGFVLIFLFLVISYSVILTTVRTTIQSKGIELEILKLVGASDIYVKNPLIYQGALFGVVSACISGILLLLLGVYFNSNAIFSGGFSLGFLPTLYIKPIYFALALFVALVLSGWLLGWVGSLKAVKKYLKY